MIVAPCYKHRLFVKALGQDVKVKKIRTYRNAQYGVQEYGEAVKYGCVLSAQHLHSTEASASLYKFAAVPQTIPQPVAYNT